MVHVGIGYDVHQLVAGRKLVLGGVEIPHTKGLDGHSDADALMHAICDAVLGAHALGSPIARTSAAALRLRPADRHAAEHGGFQLGRRSDGHICVRPVP